MWSQSGGIILCFLVSNRLHVNPKFRSTCSKKSPKPEFLRRQAALKKRLELFVVPICGNHYVSVVNWFEPFFSLLKRSLGFRCAMTAFFSHAKSFEIGRPCLSQSCSKLSGSSNSSDLIFGYTPRKIFVEKRK